MGVSPHSTVDRPFGLLEALTRSNVHARQAKARPVLNPIVVLLCTIAHAIVRLIMMALVTPVVHTYSKLHSK